MWECLGIMAYVNIREAQDTVSALAWQVRSYTTQTVLNFASFPIFLEPTLPHLKYLSIRQGWYPQVVPHLRETQLKVWRIIKPRLTHLYSVKSRKVQKILGCPPAGEGSRSPLRNLRLGKEPELAWTMIPNMSIRSPGLKGYKGRKVMCLEDWGKLPELRKRQHLPQ